MKPRALWAATALLALAAIAWIVFGGAIRERLGREAFDAALWRGEKTFSIQVRIRMVDDLLHKHDFAGKTREKVVSLLGEPDDTAYFRDYDLVYWLGDERGWMSIDSEWLVFALGPDGKVRDYDIVTD